MKTLLIRTMVLSGVCAVVATMAGCCCGHGRPCNKDATMCQAGTCCMGQPAANAKMAAPVVKEAVIDTESLAAMLRAKVPVTVLDARTGKYDDGRRVPGAKALSPTAKDEEVTAMLPDKTALVVTYCGGLKCPASHMLGEKLRGMGYVNVLEYHQGIEGWVAAGNAVQQVPK